jgi:hypothetical protein
LQQGGSDFYIVNQESGKLLLGTANASRLTIDNTGNVGIGTTAPQAKLHVSGEILTKAVNITAGADISEPFPVTGPDIPKGSVVVIDDTQPGQLKLSDRAYDTRVAGIVSGAGGVNSGLTLRQEGALEGNHNVALTGRVYALADATATPHPARRPAHHRKLSRSLHEGHGSREGQRRHPRQSHVRPEGRQRTHPGAGRAAMKGE